MNTKATASAKFRAFAKKILSVPKSEIDRREKEYQMERARIKKRRGL